jgi:hypothetical protein
MKDQDSVRKITIWDKRSGFRIKDHDFEQKIRISKWWPSLGQPTPPAVPAYPPMCDISTFSMGVASARISE